MINDLLPDNLHTNWEKISIDTERLMVFGGWIVKYINMNNHTIMGDRDNIHTTDYSYNSHIVFISDPEHEWNK